MSAYFGLRGRALVLAQILLVVLPSFVLFGYNQSGLGPLASLEDWTKHFPQIDTINTKGEKKQHNSTIQGVVIATYTLGAVIGSLSCSWTADKLGRRPVIFGGAVLTLIGQALEASAFQLPQLIVGRIFVGAGVGMLSGTVPSWQSECSDPKDRGKHVVLDGCFLCMGYFFESWINLGFYFHGPGPTQWRAPIALGTIFSILLMSVIFFMPESPRWLMMQNRRTEAVSTLAALKGVPEDDLQVKHEIDVIELVLEETKDTFSLKDMLKQGEDKLLWRFTLCMVLQAFQQLCGSNLVSVYATIIFQQNLGLDATTARILNGGILTWKFVSTSVAFISIDRFGRRAVFMFSGTGMALCMTALAIATSFPKTDYSAQIASVFFLFFFNFFVPIGFQGANFLYVTEVAPVRLRIAMSSFATANHWLWNFVITMITPVAINSIGYRYYIVFICTSGLIPPLIYFFYPETMGRKLEDIDMIFREAPSIWSIVKYAKITPDSVLEERTYQKVNIEKKEKMLEHEL